MEKRLNKENILALDGFFLLALLLSIVVANISTYDVLPVIVYLIFALSEFHLGGLGLFFINLVKNIIALVVSLWLVMILIYQLNLALSALFIYAFVLGAIHFANKINLALRFIILLTLILFSYLILWLVESDLGVFITLALLAVKTTDIIIRHIKEEYTLTTNTGD